MPGGPAATQGPALWPTAIHPPCGTQMHQLPDCCYLIKVHKQANKQELGGPFTGLAVRSPGL